MKRCTQCGALIQDDSQSCSECGCGNLIPESDIEETNSQYVNTSGTGLAFGIICTIFMVIVVATHKFEGDTTILGAAFYIALGWIPYAAQKHNDKKTNEAYKNASAVQQFKERQNLSNGIVYSMIPAYVEIIPAEKVILYNYERIPLSSVSGCTLLKENRGTTRTSYQVLPGVYRSHYHSGVVVVGVRLNMRDLNRPHIDISMGEQEARNFIEGFHIAKSMK